MYETTYHRPSSVDEAAALFGKGKDAKYLAGGHTLLPVMKQRLAAPSDVIDLGKIKELVGIEAFRRRADHQGGDDPLRRCAKRTSAEGHRCARPSRLVDRRPRGAPYAGTIGGSIANNDPAADYPAAVLALGAAVKTNKRTIAADDFFKGLFTTALADGEIITEVSIRFRPRRDIPSSATGPRASR